MEQPLMIHHWWVTTPRRRSTSLTNQAWSAVIFRSIPATILSTSAGEAWL
jgi:hypothetical protein